MSKAASPFDQKGGYGFLLVGCGSYEQFFNTSNSHVYSKDDLKAAYICGSHGAFNTNTSHFTSTNTSYVYDCGENYTVSVPKDNITGEDLNYALGCGHGEADYVNPTSSSKSGGLITTVPSNLGLLHALLILGGYLFSSI